MESVSNMFTEQSIPDVSDGASFTNWLGVVPSTSIPASQSGSSSAHRDAITLTWMISGPIIFFVGICGNALILVVMTRHKMTGTSTCVHLCIMALADMVVLTIGLVPEWFEVSLKRKFKEIHPVTCKLEKFLFYTSGDTSIWVLVIFTLDRLVAIAFPLRKKSVCTPSRAKLFGAVVLACAVVKNFHVFWTRGPEYKMGKNNDTYILRSNCGKPTPGFNQFESFIRPWIVFATVNVIPFAVILCCNVVIIRALCRVRRVATIGALVSPSVATDRSMVQMTAMCLSASFCFLVCITPSIIVIIGRPYWEKTAPYDTAKGVSNMLTYVNHSVNFFLYCVTGRRFRRLLAWWACRRCLPGFAGAMGGESTEAHVTFMHRGSSAFGGFSRKSSVGIAVDGPRRASQDYVRSNSHVTRFGDRTKENARETDV